MTPLAAHAVDTDALARSIAPRTIAEPERCAEDLARDAQAGSLRAFTELVEMYETRVFSFLRRRTRNEADAEEMTQETFLRAWKSLPRYDPSRPFTTWLFTIASRIATDAFRKKITAREQAFSGEPGDDHDRNEERRLGNEAWIAAGDVLSERQHIAVWLRYVENMAPADIAVVLGVTGPTARIILFRARQAIARALEERGHTPAQRGYSDQTDCDGGDA